jgi:hypothetical protein
MQQQKCTEDGAADDIVPLVKFFRRADDKRTFFFQNVEITG